MYTCVLSRSVRSVYEIRGIVFCARFDGNSTRYVRETCLFLSRNVTVYSVYVWIEHLTEERQIQLQIIRLNEWQTGDKLAG